MYSAWEHQNTEGQVVKIHTSIIRPKQTRRQSRVKGRTLETITLLIPNLINYVGWCVNVRSGAGKYLGT